MAIGIMNEEGIEISGYRPDVAAGPKPMHFYYVETVCDSALEPWPVFSCDPRRQLRGSLPDPSATEGDDGMRSVRDDLSQRIENFFAGEKP